jgi:acetoin utilization protein AcuB
MRSPIRQGFQGFLGWVLNVPPVCAKKYALSAGHAQEAFPAPASGETKEDDMLIGNWMTKDPISVTPDTSMMRAAKTIKDKAVHMLPVVDADNKVVGVVTDRDLKEASPSKATTLDVHELYYLLSEIKVKDIMTSKVYSLTPEDTVERAAVLMRDKRIGGLPIVDAENRLRGVITESDVLDVLIKITGVLHGGFQIGIALSNQPGSLLNVIEDLGRLGCRIMSILTAYESKEENQRHVFIRVMDMDKSSQKKVLEELGAKFSILFTTRDDVPAVRP